LYLGVAMVIPVPAVEFRPFEKEIIKLWKEGVADLPWKWGTTATSPKGRFIQGFLKEKGQAYIKEMWQGWADFCDRAEKVDAHFKKGDYATMRVYVWLLKKLGLIRLVKRVASVRKGFFERSIYAMNPKKISDPAWTRPLQTLYPSADWRVMPKERKREVRRRTKARRREKRALERVRKPPPKWAL